MSKYFLTEALITCVLLGLTVVSCGGPVSNQNKTAPRTPEEMMKDRYEQMLETAETVKVADSTFFLGFRMGMSPKEVADHSRELVMSKKLKRSGSKYFYTYKSTGIREADYQLKLSFNYYEEELYECVLTFTGKNGNGQRYNSGVIDQLAFIEYLDFCKALEKNHYEPMFFKNVVTDKTEKKMLKGNVEVYYSYDSYYFIDLYRENLKRTNEKNAAEKTLADDLK